MLIRPTPYRRGDSLDNFEGTLVGAIGAFSKACVEHKHLEEPLEVLLVQGNKASGFYARLGDAHHHLFEGKLTEAQVSFTLEAFSMQRTGDPLANLKKDSATLFSTAKKELREHILETVQKHNVGGALLYVKGIANDLHTYGHTDPNILNDQTKTFDHQTGPLQIEGWGNFSLIDGEKPFVHVHGTYTTPQGEKLGGHFIMDDKTCLFVEKVELLIHPISKLIRSMESETFPTWR